MYSYSIDALKTATEKIIKGELSIRKAAASHQIPKNTLARYVLKVKNTPDGVKVNFRPSNEHLLVFNSSEELLLKKYIQDAVNMHHGLSFTQVRRLAFEFAIANNKNVKCNWTEEKMAGIEWLHSFMRRQSLALRTPEQTSLSRCTSFNKTNVGAFFSNLEGVINRFNLQAQDIFNLDETGLTSVHKPVKVLALKGQKQVGQATSAERGVLVTACCIVGATGTAIPPYLLFPRVFFKEHMIKGAPVGTKGAATKSGWMISDIFIDVLKHFVDHVRPTTDSPKLILLDNHESHLSIAALNYAKTNGIMLLTFPPHCSHKLQPLDVSVFGPLKKHYNRACNDWMTNHPATPIAIYDIGELLGTAFPLAFTPRNISQGFKAAGIYPFDSQIFTEEDFLAATVTDRPDPTVSDTTIESTTLPSTSVSTTIEIPTSLTDCQLISPEQIRPFPKAGMRKNNRKPKQKGKSAVLTDTPVKRQLEEAAQMRANKSKPKSIAPRKEKRKILIESSDEGSSELEYADSSLDISELSSGEDTDDFNQPITVDDFVLAMVHGAKKKSSRHYIAKIISKTQDGFSVKWLKNQNRTTKFYITDEELTFVPASDIVRKLLTPLFHGETGRFANLYSFQFDFSNYSIVM